jgi:hypothetical protein
LLALQHEHARIDARHVSQRIRQGPRRFALMHAPTVRAVEPTKTRQSVGPTQNTSSDGR